MRKQPKFEIFQAFDSMHADWRWHLKGANGEIVAQGEGYASQRNAKRAVDRIVTLATTAKIVNLGQCFTEL